MPPPNQAAQVAPTPQDIEAASPLASPPTRLRTLADLSGPPGVPIFGNALQMDRHRIHQNMEALCRQYGPFFKVRFASRTVLVVGDHEASAKILKARPSDFRRSTRLVDAARSLGLDMGLFMAEGETWNRQRRMVMASFAPQRIRAYFPSMLNVTRRLHDRWLKAARSQEGIDLQADLMLYTVDTITGLALGHDVNTIEADGDVIQRHLDVIFPAMFKRILSVVRYWKVIKLPSDREVERHVAEVNRAIDGFVKQARTRLRDDPARRADPSNLLEALIVAAESEDGGVSDADVKGNVMTMLLAGEDTTANTLAWLIYLLKQNPATLARAQQEVQAVAPRGLADFTPDTMARLDYIEACANEAMRLKPVAPFLPVQATRDVVVADIAVPEGTLVWNALRTDSVSAQHLSEPEAFQPERWLSAGSQVKHLAMPFGSGPRICPGRYLALLEIKMALAMLLSHFDITAVETPDGEIAREMMAFTMGPESLTMHIQARAMP